jgi:hypothetical protein
VTRPSSDPGDASRCEPLQNADELQSCSCRTVTPPMAWSLPTPSQRTPRHAPGRSVTVAAPNYSAWQSLKHDNLQDYGRFRTIPKLPEGRTASPPLADSRRVADASRRARARSDDGAHIAMTRAFWRREPDATLRQAPKSHTRSFNSMGMSALLRTTDSTRTSRHVRDVPILLQKAFCLTDHKFSGL